MALKLTLNWKEGMQFSAIADQHEVAMDAKAPIGRGTAQNPKQLVIAGLVGCTGMDLMAFMRKKRQEVRSFEVHAEVETIEATKTYPAVFRSAHLTFRLTGDVDPRLALEGVSLSQTLHCGVSAMLSKAFPISYEVFVNEVSVGRGEASFVHPSSGIS
jgi:putative redox protein